MTDRISIGPKFTKDDIALAAHRYANDVAEGRVGALDMFIMAKGVEKIASALVEKLKSDAFSEVDRYRDGGLHGVGVSTAEQEVYDFSGDQTWAELAKEISEVSDVLTSLKEKQKALESKLKAIEAPVADIETGVIYTPAVYKYSKSRIVMKFPKD